MPGTKLFAALAVFLVPVLHHPPAETAEVVGRRFDSPRAYFAQGTLNKGGYVSALRGQDNFLRIFLTAVESSSDIDPESLAYRVYLPAGAEFLDAGDVYAHAVPVSFGRAGPGGEVYAEGRLDPAEFRRRCVDNAYGLEFVLWYRADGLKPGGDYGARLTLGPGESPVFEDSCSLRVFEELSFPERVNPENFKFWLHYGPFFRGDDFDSAADYLRRAGINAVQLMAWRTDAIREMSKRDFFVIAQRGGSYSGVYRDFNAVIDEGPEWFERSDGGRIREIARYADGVKFNFEPSPGRIDTDPETLKRFREHAGTGPGPLDESIIRERYFGRWIEFNQKRLAAVVGHWADWSRSIDPGIETFLTEGRTNIFDPSGQIDYRNVSGYVDYCGPMNWNGLNAVNAMRQWQAAAPDVRFTGCMNVAYQAQSPVFVSPNTIMLQIASSALMGHAGVQIYPGQVMDAENFTAFNRVMTFLGASQRLLWETEKSPGGLRFTPLAKEDSRIALGDGRVIRNLYPDWDSESVVGTYGGPEGFLAAVVNWNAVEPCYARLQLTGARGRWVLSDRENRVVYTSGGSVSIPASLLEVGVIVKTPPSDFRGFHLEPSGEDAYAGYQRKELETLEKLYLAYSAGREADGPEEEGNVEFGYDDITGDDRFEYRVSTDSQSVWISQAGSIIRWESGGVVLRTDGMGLCRDQLWLPSGERGNTAFDSIMTLESRRIYGDRAELSLSRSVSLDSLGAMADLRMTRRFVIRSDSPEIDVEVEFHNTSLAMGLGPIPLSYRVHNHLAYEEPGRVLVYDGNSLSDFGRARNYSIPGLPAATGDDERIWRGGTVAEPLNLEAFGEYMPGEGLLVSFVPEDSSALLQLLRWLSRDGSTGTLEWIYRPVEVGSGQRWKASYTMSLLPAPEPPSARVMALAAAGRAREEDSGELIFHADFNDTADAVVSSGRGEADVSGGAVYEDTPGGRGLIVDGNVSVTYRPEGNIDLSRGRMSVRFKPLWDGTDDASRYFMVIQPAAGHVYFGKLGDGRMLMNMFDAANKQHYPWHSVRSLMKSGEWYEAMSEWDTSRGYMAIYLDGAKLAERRYDPWEMPPLDNENPRCVMRIPAGAGMVIDEIKIWR